MHAEIDELNRRMIRCVERSPDERERQGQERLASQKLFVTSIVVCLVAAVLAVSLSIVFYYLLLRPSGPIVRGNISQLTEIGKVSLGVVAGLGGVVALVISFKRQQLSELSHKIAVSSLERDRQRILNERFASAVAQLGDNSSASVRIGGVYSLAKLADDWPADRQRCIDVLCAYLRFPMTDPDDKGDEAEVRRTLSSVIQEHLKAHAPVRWDSNTFNLRGASLDGLILANIVLAGGILILIDCKVTTGNFDLSGVLLKSGTIDATGLVMTGGKIDLRKAKIQGGQLLFKGAHFGGGNLSLADSMAYKGRISFDGSKIDGGKLDLSGIQVWCPSKRFADNVRVSLDNLVISDGLLNLQYSHLAVADNERRQPDEGDINDYLVLTMEHATMTGGRISLNKTELTFGKLAFRNLTMSGGVLDCSLTKIHERAQIDLRNLAMRGGSIDFSNAWIGSTTPDQEIPDIGCSWVRRLKKEKAVESRNVVQTYRHPPGHINLSNSTIEDGLVSFEQSQLGGAIVLLSSLEMSGGRIGFDFCFCKKAVVSLWNARLVADAVIDFTQKILEPMESPVIIYSQCYGGLGEHVRLHEPSRLLEVSAVD